MFKVVVSTQDVETITNYGIAGASALLLDRIPSYQTSPKTQLE